MDTNADSPLTSDEKLLSAAAHASIILLTFGVFIPAFIWALGGRRSPRIAFQAAQALAFQLLQALVMMVVVFFLAILMVLAMTVAAAAAPNRVEPIFILEALFLSAIFGAYGLYILVGLIGAIACLSGKNFHYPLLGSWIERYIHQPMVPTEAAI